MKLFVAAALILCASAVGRAAFIWADPSKIKHYSADELAKLSCEALSERHNELIDAYHDAEIAYKRRTGAFHDDLGLPPEDVVPFAVLIKRFVRDNNISEAHIEGKFPSTPILSSGFYYEVSAICATNPSWQATDAIRQAALSLGLIDE
ncbi:hypothetical protein AB9K34_09200 [Sedimentitalea sp. XS_ASV28]|uniref:hypothetical protein n=1 Tax=Sedimentitalea sp. XS_ASV28 TaxID=3241296 RepID=UPI00351987D4